MLVIRSLSGQFGKTFHLPLSFVRDLVLFLSEVLRQRRRWEGVRGVQKGRKEGVRAIFSGSFLKQLKIIPSRIACCF